MPLAGLEQGHFRSKIPFMCKFCECYVDNLSCGLESAERGPYSTTQSPFLSSSEGSLSGSVLFSVWIDDESKMSGIAKAT